MKYFPVMFILLLFIFFSCSSAKNNRSESLTSSALKPYVLKFKRGPCFGQCPVYSFYLLSDHSALVHAKANLMDTTGWYQANPDQESIVEILELIEPQEWWIQEMRDQPEIADLPSSTLIYHHNTGVRKITIQSRTTHSLENVFGKIAYLVSDSRWVPTKLRPLEEDVADPTNLIVQLEEGIDINTWMKKYDHFGIRLIKRIAPRQSYYLVTKDPSLGHANDFLQYIKNDPDVVDAQWDRELGQRN